MIVWLLALCGLIVITGVSVTNALSFPRLRRVRPARAPFVSLLVPARNEEAVIAETVKRLLAQDYPAFELIVLDDQSEDGTRAIALQAARGDRRFEIIGGEPLPPGWLGKNWACHRLSGEAHGEVLVFTDADVRWEPGTLSAVVALMEQSRADLLSVWPTQQTVTWAERLVIPMMMFVVVGYLPELAVRHVQWPVFAAANGQCIVIRRDVYEDIGGHAAVRSNVIEDMGLAWNTKRARHRLVIALGEDLIGARMYRNWRQVREGFAKNILAGHANSPFLLLLSALFHWTLFFIPWLWLLLGVFLPAGAAWPWLPLALVGLGLGARMLTAAVTHQRLGDALLLPVSVVLMTIITGQAFWWQFARGGPQWKGRTVVHRN